MQEAIDETSRRREKQVAYNQKHGITPQTIKKAIRRGIELELRARQTARDALHQSEEVDEAEIDKDEVLAEIEKQMLAAAESLEFEKAAELRDRIEEIKAAPDLGALLTYAGKPKGAKGSKPGKGKRRNRGKAGKPGMPR
jgi:excinuclease ABC subunit B